MQTVETRLIVVERVSRKKDHAPRCKLHAAIQVFNPDQKTVCGLTYSNRTMIPLTSWGKSGGDWCCNCRSILSSLGRSELEDSALSQRE